MLNLRMKHLSCESDDTVLHDFSRRLREKNGETKMKKDKLSANIIINRVLFVNYYRLPIYKWRKKVKH